MVLKEIPSMISEGLLMDMEELPSILSKGFMNSFEGATFYVFERLFKGFKQRFQIIGLSR